MKLRNKKTGEIATLDSEHTDSLVDFAGKLLIEAGGKEFSYDTLAELNEDWEDYKPTEPLIKDEKVLKAVKIVAMVGVDNMLKNQIDGDDSIVGFEDCMVYLTTKNRKSIGIDVWKPEIDHSNERRIVTLLDKEEEE